MKVLQVMAGHQVGGAETAYADTVIALHKAGLDQHTIIREGAPCGDMFRSHNIPVLELPFRKYFDFKTGGAFKRTIQSYQPDIVQTWMKSASISCP